MSEQIETRLEVPFANGVRGATDLVLRSKDAVFGIELKYLTKGLQCDFRGERFQLAQHGAHPLRRYDVLKDVGRLERFNLRHGGESFVIVLTNDPAYWKSNDARSTVDAAFRIGEGSEVSGTLGWSKSASAGTTKGRNAPLELAGSYTMGWRDYSDLGVPKGNLRYLLVSVN